MEKKNTMNERSAKSELLNPFLSLSSSSFRSHTSQFESRRSLAVLPQTKKRSKKEKVDSLVPPFFIHLRLTLAGLTNLTYIPRISLELTWLIILFFYGLFSGNFFGYVQKLFMHSAKRLVIENGSAAKVATKNTVEC